MSLNFAEREFQKLPKHWQEWIKTWSTNSSQGKRDRLTDIDFASGSAVEIRHRDGSYLNFKNAFYALDEQRKEIIVFTEHLGYFVFSTLDLECYHYYEQKKCPAMKEKSNKL